eukprot:6900604-Prymnesium_polylepis.1
MVHTVLWSTSMQRVVKPGEERDDSSATASQERPMATNRAPDNLRKRSAPSSRVPVPLRLIARLLGQRLHPPQILVGERQPLAGVAAQGAAHMRGREPARDDGAVHRPRVQHARVLARKEQPRAVERRAELLHQIVARVRWKEGEGAALERVVAKARDHPPGRP